MSGVGTGKVDWKFERERVDLVALLTRYIGTPPGRGGRGLWWNCPFHEDPNPSFNADPDRRTWHCFGCRESGDAAGFVMKVESLTFPEAVGRILGGESLVREVPTKPQGKTRSPESPGGLPVGEATSLLEDAVARLWGDDGIDALMELTGSRGLDFATIRRAGLGYIPGLTLTNQKGRPYTVRGIVIPWFDAAG